MKIKQIILFFIYFLSLTACNISEFENTKIDFHVVSPLVHSGL